MTQTIEYQFSLSDGRSFHYRLSLQDQRYRLINDQPLAPPEWTRLSHQQCVNCPLRETDTPHCPAAVNIAQLVDDVSQLVSYEKLDVTVTMPQRTVTTHTSAQQAISSLLGLLLASSDCPHCRFMQPMARFHLPMADDYDTVYRATSMYLLAQYLRATQQLPADFSLNGLGDIYRQLQQVNFGLAARLRGVCAHDASINAVIVLDLLAKEVPYAMEESLQQLLPVFSSYLEDGQG